MFNSRFIYRQFMPMPCQNHSSLAISTLRGVQLLNTRKADVGMPAPIARVPTCSPLCLPLPGRGQGLLSPRPFQISCLKNGQALAVLPKNNYFCTIMKQGTILIVDDNRNILTTVKMLLEGVFARITTIASPGAASTTATRDCTGCAKSNGCIPKRKWCSSRPTLTYNWP